jgi:hypothetical protein
MTRMDDTYAVPTSAIPGEKLRYSFMGASGIVVQVATPLCRKRISNIGNLSLSEMWKEIDRNRKDWSILDGMCGLSGNANLKV